MRPDHEDPEHRPAQHGDLDKSADNPIVSRSDVDRSGPVLPARDIDKQSGLEESARAAGLPLSTYREVALHMARTFLKEAPALFESLSDSLSPMNLKDEMRFISAQSGSEFNLRSRYLAAREDVNELLERGHEITESLQHDLGQKDYLGAAHIATTELQNLVTDVELLFDRLQELNKQTAEVFMIAERAAFPSLQGLEQQHGATYSLGQYQTIMDSYISPDLADGVHDSIEIGNRAGWRPFKLAAEEPTIIDINTFAVSAFLASRTAQVAVSEATPTALVKPTTFRLLLSASQAWLEETAREAASKHLKTLAVDNALFDQITDPGFMDSEAGCFLETTYMKSRSCHLQVHDNGAVTIDLEVSELILPEMQKAGHEPGELLSALIELGNQSQLDLNVSTYEGKALLTLTPKTVSTAESDSLERLTRVLPPELLGLQKEIEVDELGVPQFDPLAQNDDQMQSPSNDSALILLPRIIQDREDTTRGYLFGTQAAGIKSAEAGAKLRELASRVDLYMQALPKMSISAVHKISVRAIQTPDRPILLSEDIAMPLEQAYQSGRFDSIDFTTAADQLGTPSPQWAAEVRNKLDQIFPWTEPHETLPAARLGSGSKAADALLLQEGRSRITLDQEALLSDEVLELLRTIDAQASIRALTLCLMPQSIAEFGEPELNLRGLELLEEVARVVAHTASALNDTELSCSLIPNSLPRIAANAGPETLILEVRDDKGHPVLKGHVDNATDKIVYRMVEHADNTEVTERIERALESSEDRGDTSSRNSLHTLVPELEANGVRIDDFTTGVLLLLYTNQPDLHWNKRQAIERLLDLPGVYVTREKDNTLVVRCHDSQELTPSS